MDLNQLAGSAADALHDPIKVLILFALTWAVGKAQAQGGPIIWLTSLFQKK